MSHVNKKMKRASLVPGRQELTPKDILKTLVTQRLVRPEKFKLLIAYAQVVSNVKEVYPRVYPQKVEEYLASLASTNMDFVKISGIACVLPVDFYRNFVFNCFLPLMVCFILKVLDMMGVMWFNRQLAQHPCRCIHCGEKLPKGGRLKTHTYSAAPKHHFKPTHGGQEFRGTRTSMLAMYSSEIHEGCKKAGMPMPDTSIAKSLFLKNG
jgi:hypothetical protein